MPKELIFTSVPTGINPGSTGYCTVAKHKDIDRLLERELETVSFYELMDVEYKPVVNAYRVLKINTGTFYVLTRVSFSGSDHTGRTNYLAHNLIFDESEIMAMQASPADFFLDGRGWLSSWPTDRSPIFYNPGQGEKSLFLNPLLRNDLAQPTWTSLSGNPHSAYELFYYGQLKFLTIGGDYKKMLGLLSEFSLVANEARKQWVWEHFTFTSYLQSSDRVSDFKIVAGTDGNENLAQLNWDTVNLFSASPTSIFKASNTDIFSELPIQHKQPEPQQSVLQAQSVGESASSPVENTASVSSNINPEVVHVDSSPSVQFVENNLTTKYLKPQSSVAPKGLDIPPPTNSSKLVWYLIGFTFLILAGLTGYLFFPMVNEETEQDTKIVQKEIHERDSGSDEGFDVPPATTSEDDEESNQSVAISEEKKNPKNVPNQKQETPPSNVSPLPIGDIVIPAENIFKIPDDWKEAKITIHEAFDSSNLEEFDQNYIWDGKKFTISNQQVESVKNIVFGVRKEERYSNISDVHIYPFKNSACKVIFKLSNFKKIESKKLTSSLANELEGIYSDFMSQHRALNPNYLLVSGNISSPGSRQLSEIKKRFRDEKFIISFNERENFDFEIKELEEYEKLFKEILSAAKKRLADSKNAISEYEKIKQDYMEFTGVEKIEDLNSNTKLLLSLEQKLFVELPILNNSEQISEFKSFSSSIFEGNPGELKYKKQEKVYERIVDLLKKHYEIDKFIKIRRQAQHKVENSKANNLAEAEDKLNRASEDLRIAKDKYNSSKEIVDELPKKTNELAKDHRSARKGPTSPSRWSEEDITIMKNYKILLEKLKNITIQYNSSGNGFPWVIRTTSVGVVLEVLP
jgi:hypothetical protein